MWSAIIHWNPCSCKIICEVPWSPGISRVPEIPHLSWEGQEQRTGLLTLSQPSLSLHQQLSAPEMWLSVGGQDQFPCSIFHRIWLITGGLISIYYNDPMICIIARLATTSIQRNIQCLVSVCRHENEVRDWWCLWLIGDHLLAGDGSTETEVWPQSKLICELRSQCEGRVGSCKFSICFNFAQYSSHSRGSQVHYNCSTDFLSISSFYFSFCLTSILPSESGAVCLITRLENLQLILLSSFLCFRKQNFRIWLIGNIPSDSVCWDVRKLLEII